jgi:hypothetical protein
MLLREGHVYMPALFNLSYAQLSYDIIIALTSLKLYIFGDVLFTDKRVSSNQIVFQLLSMT